MAQNEDGTWNSCGHPARAGSIVSFFVDGVGGQVTFNGDYIPVLPGAIPAVVQLGNRSAEVVNIAVDNDFVFRIDVRVPAGITGAGVSLTRVSMSLDPPAGEVPVGPRSGFSPSNPAGAPLATSIWISP